MLAQCIVTKTVDLTWGISLGGKSPSKIIIALSYMFPYYPNLQTSKHLAIADSTVKLVKKINRIEQNKSFQLGYCEYPHLLSYTKLS